jgi:hypothetical protein
VVAGVNYTLEYFEHWGDVWPLMKKFGKTACARHSVPEQKVSGCPNKNIQMGFFKKMKRT